MLVAEVRTLDPLTQFEYWVKERHNIFLRKRARREAPWTDDEVFQRTWFTNPYRQNDKVTRWFNENIREPLKDSPGILFATIAFRWFNWPTTGLLLLGKSKDYPGGNLLTEWDTKEAVFLLNRAKEDGFQIFTGAFNISNSGSTKPKINRVCEDYIQPAWEACGPDGWMRDEMLRGAYEGKMNLEDAFDLLSELPGLGGSGFMAGQVIADLKYTHYLEGASDWWTWCTAGPGSKRGLNRLLGRPVDVSIKENFMDEVNVLREHLNEKLRMPKFDAQNVQNCLCEFDKYLRVLYGEGQSKRKYKGV
jgi:hypothetical protein